jgi:adenylyltransferase/sulfurtransferase
LGDSLSGTLLMYDALRSSFHKIVLPRDPDCPSCGRRA